MTTGRTQNIELLLDPKEGYGVAAAKYDSWHWSEFWKRNEAPYVHEWLSILRPGMGLDAGSGTGSYRETAEIFGHRIVGVDVSDEMLEIQRQKYGKLGRDLKRGEDLFTADIRHLPFKQELFDWILATRVISHVFNLKQIFEEFDRVLKPGGELLITDIHPEHEYEHTKINFLSTNIAIKSYKHPIKSLKQVANSRRMTLLDFHEIGMQGLIWKPNIEPFSKLKRKSEQPIFYVCKIRKT